MLVTTLRGAIDAPFGLQQALHPAPCYNTLDHRLRFPLVGGRQRCEILLSYFPRGWSFMCRPPEQEPAPARRCIRRRGKCRRGTTQVGTVTGLSSSSFTGPSLR